MFTQITTELSLLAVEIEKIMDVVSNARANEYNPNLFNEYGGRLIGLTEALAEIQKTQLIVNDHIADILKNTADGNYVEKLNVINEENIVLRNKIDLLEKDLQKYDTLRKNKLAGTPPDCLKELSHEEITKKIDDAYNSDVDILDEYYDDDEDEGEE
mgnify:CR=1 FL=1